MSFLGPCSAKPVYADGGITSLEHTFTVNNWWLAGTAADVQTAPFSNLARGPWYFICEILSPYTIDGVTGSFPWSMANSIDFSILNAAGPSVVSPEVGYPDYSVADYLRWGYRLEIPGTGLTRARVIGPMAVLTCVLNVTTTEDVGCSCGGDCNMPPSYFAGLGYDDTTPRDIVITVSNDQVYLQTGTAGLELADWVASGIPEHTTFRVRGFIGYPPP